MLEPHLRGVVTLALEEKFCVLLVIGVWRQSSVYDVGVVGLQARNS
jgi:hypothetical protein